MALYDSFVRGVGRERPQGEIGFPHTPREIEDCMRWFFRHARLPGVLGAVDVCLIQTPLQWSHCNCLDAASRATLTAE
jgi:hypothetical protein